jgi:hypothetical protein
MDNWEALNKEWTETLLQLWYAYGKTPNAAQVKTYRKQLGNVNLGHLELAVSHLLANHKYNSVPTIAEVLQAVEDTSHAVTATPFVGEYQAGKRNYTVGEYLASYRKVAVNVK